jgi:hypothetical protein
MEKQRKQARTAGLLYLALVVLGILNMIVIPGQYVVRGDPVATIANIQAAEPVFRLGIIVGVLSDAVYILLAFAFYRLLAPVGRTAATLLVVFAAAGAGLGLVSAAARLNVLTVVDIAPFLTAFTAEQLQAQAILSLRSASNLLRVAELFWGLWLFPLGLLVFRSGFLPRAFGVLLMAGSFGYAISFFANILWPVYATTSLPMLVPLPAHIGEIGIMLWLVIVGTTLRKSATSREHSPSSRSAVSTTG